MTDLEFLAAELRHRTQWQDTPEEMADDDYLEIVRQAVRHMYVMTGRQAQYGAEDVPVQTADEFEYVLTTAEIGYYRRVQSSVNRIVGYTTDAMSITNADKPYVNIAQTISELMSRQRVLYYKMVRYTML